MALAETAELVARLDLKGNFDQVAAKARTTLRRLNVDTVRLRDGLHKVGQGLIKGFKTAAGIAAGGLAFLALNIKKGIDSLVDLEDKQLQTQAVLKSTGKAAGVTAEEVRSLAEEYEDLTTIDDKVIQGGENILLTFTNVRKRAFEPAIAAALDMSTALKMDVNSAFRTVGRALQDPITGLSRLSRLGVTFTEVEQEKIETLVESGRTLDAQRMVLARLNRMYGGSAAKAAQGYRGQVNRLGDAVEELQQSLAGPLLRPLTRVSRRLAEFAKTKDVQDGIRGIGQAFASLFDDRFVPGDDQGSVKRIVSPFTAGLETLKGAFTTVRDLPWDSIRGGLQKTFDVAAKAVDLFKGLPPELQTALITLLAANKLTGGLVASGLRDIASVALKSLTTITAGAVTVIGKTVTGPGGTGGVVPAPGGKGTSAGGILSGLGGLKGLITGGVVGAIAAMQEQSVFQTSDPRVQELLANNPRMQEQLDRWNQRIEGNTDRTAERIGNLPTSIQPVISPIFGRFAEQAVILESIRAAQHQGTVATRTQTAHLSAKAEVQAKYAMRQVPLLGDVRYAVDRTAQAIRQKDMSVRVNVSMSSTTVAQGVTRQWHTNRVVAE